MPHCQQVIKFISYTICYLFVIVSFCSKSSWLYKLHYVKKPVFFYMAILLHYVFFTFSWGAWRKHHTHDPRCVKVKHRGLGEVAPIFTEMKVGIFFDMSPSGPKLGQLLYISLKGTVARWWFQTSNIFLFSPLTLEK